MYSKSTESVGHFFNCNWNFACEEYNSCGPEIATLPAASVVGYLSHDEGQAW